MEALWNNKFLAGLNEKSNEILGKENWQKTSSIREVFAEVNEKGTKGTVMLGEKGADCSGGICFSNRGNC